MSLFQTQVERQYLAGITTDLSTFYNKYLAYFGNTAIQANILEVIEEQYQGEFIRALFVDILGYTAQPHPNFNLLREKKNETDSKSADAAISIDNQIVVVIELKDHKTQDLKKVEVQAFGYKNNHKNCHYVVTSNFERLRFYIDNAVDFIEFDLFKLTFDDFRRLWLCLSYESIAKNLPQQIKNQSISNEDVVTKELYKDYSVFKRQLFDSMVSLNPEFDKLLLFKKTQKLLDRFLFLFFAEDKELLPANSVKGTVEKWKKFNTDPMNDYQSLYSRFVKYFKLLDTGYKDATTEIYAYNGGLFANDDLLNQVKVEDAVLSENVLKLATYDYETDVDVNILGHIFENSLNEIEEVKEMLDSNAFSSSLGKSGAVSKRKQDGVFYTPRYITQYIVENTIGRLCEEKKTELAMGHAPQTMGHTPQTMGHAPSQTMGHAPLHKKEKQALYDKFTAYREWLLQITIVDPACGSGAFLNTALDFLIAEHKWIDNQQDKIAGSKDHYSMGLSNIENTILENNLFGVDINEESVEIAKLSLWLRTAKPHRKLSSLNNNIKCGNSLIDDPAVAGEKAFDWHREFPQIFQLKKKKAWHITTATHNSRYSQRMFDNYVKLGEPVWLTNEEELIITRTIAEIAEKDQLNILAYNICGDHMHIALVCEEEEVEKIVGKLKSMSARAANIAMGRTIPTTTGRTRGHAPSSDATPVSHDGKATPLSYTVDSATLSDIESNLVSERGETQTQLWTQKFFHREITSAEQLRNTIAYIRNNRRKHGLPDLDLDLDLDKGACPLVIAPIYVAPDFDTPVSDTPVSDTPNSDTPNSESPLANIPVIFPRTVSPEYAFRPEYKGGFDVVIGNPPYGAQISDKEKQYYISRFKISPSIIDTYLIFIKNSLNILKSNCELGFIIPSTWLYMSQFNDFRNQLICNYEIPEITLYRNFVFEAATVETCITFIKKVKPNSNSIYKFSEWNITEKLSEISTNQLNIIKDPNNSLLLKDKEINKLFLKISENIELSKIAKIVCGLTPYRLGKGIPKQTSDIVDNRLFDSSFKKNETYRQYLMGRDFNRYMWQIEQERWISYGKWLAEPRYAAPFDESQKIIIRQTSDRIIAHLDTNKYISLKNVHNLKIINDKINYKYLLSILNSRLIDWWYQKLIPEKGRVFAEVKVINLNKLPIKLTSDEQLFISKVDEMLSLNKNLQEISLKFQRMLQRKFELAELPGKLQNWYQLTYKEFIAELGKKKVKLTLAQEAEWEDYFLAEKAKAIEIKKQIDDTDREIDRMVYALYGLTDEEIKIVEGEKI